jgi:TolB-like protein
MSLKKIKVKNGEKFVADLRQVSTILVYASTSSLFLKVRKMDVRKQAQEEKIHYYLTDTIFVVKRMVMVII